MRSKSDYMALCLWLFVLTLACVWIVVNDLSSNILLVVLMMFYTAYVFRFGMIYIYLKILAFILFMYSVLLFLFESYQYIRFNTIFQGNIQTDILGNSLESFIWYSFVYLFPTIFTFYFSFAIGSRFQIQKKVPN